MNIARECLAIRVKRKLKHDGGYRRSDGPVYPAGVTSIRVGHGPEFNR